jgi:hypothetical protein
VRLQARFGVDITPEMLLDRPTIAELVVHLVGPQAEAAKI